MRGILAELVVRGATTSLNPVTDPEAPPSYRASLFGPLVLWVKIIGGRLPRHILVSKETGMNETILRFGYPGTLIREYEHWVVLLRPAQPTLGSLILAAKSEVRSFPELTSEAFAELRRAAADVEAALSAAVRHEKINYLMLMMVDPHVHFHVIPRYEGERSACGVSVTDAGWPKAPALGEAVEPTEGQAPALVAHFKSYWPGAEA
jgi:diadenosine tetraphosphate (Ap4A) HIT family hydrolase